VSVRDAVAAQKLFAIAEREAMHCEAADAVSSMNSCKATSGSGCCASLRNPTDAPIYGRSPSSMMVASGIRDALRPAPKTCCWIRKLSGETFRALGSPDRLPQLVKVSFRSLSCSSRSHGSLSVFGCTTFPCFVFAANEFHARLSFALYQHVHGRDAVVVRGWL
jgi:hypothetical protein